MATSGSVNFNPTQQVLIKGALRNINAIATGETPTPAEMSEASEAFNMMIKAWPAEGIGLWLNDTFDLTLVANQVSYTIGTGGNVNIPRPLEIIEARFYYTSGGNEIPMIPMYGKNILICRLKPQKVYRHNIIMIHNYR